MNARSHREWEHRDVLKKNGWPVSKRDSVAFNGGSESFPHWVAKCLVAYALKEDGYRVSSEVAKDGVGEIDVVAYGTEDEPVAIEVETSPTDDVVSDKLQRYVRGEPYRDMLLVDVDAMPETIDEAYEFVQGEL